MTVSDEQHIEGTLQDVDGNEEDRKQGLVRNHEQQCGDLSIHSGPEGLGARIVISAEVAATGRRWFRVLDGGDVYSDILADRGANPVAGTVRVVEGSDAVDVNEMGDPDDRVRVILRRRIESAKASRTPVFGAELDATGYVKRDGIWHETPVMIVPLRADLFSRVRGLLDTDILADKSVFIPGVGSVGSTVACELAKTGIMDFALMDPDRVEVANVVRHVVGLSDVGRLKVLAMADVIRQKNPSAHVETCNRKVTWDTQDLVRQYVCRSDLVLCMIDDDDGRAIVNMIAVEEGKPIIFAGAFQRAYGGQVLYVRPAEGTPCFECFRLAAPTQVHDREVSNAEQAQRLAYSDRPVAAEPGLSNDIAPISQMVVKLAIQQLIMGRDTTLRSLDEDLVATWLIWLNRREGQYQNLEPLEYNVNDMHIMRWYGIGLPRNPTCPVCGDTDAIAALADGFEIDGMGLEALGEGGGSL